MDTTLEPGVQLHCPHCRTWHDVVAAHAEGTDYTRRMLYWRCRERLFYAGQLGTAARFATRRLDRAAAANP